MKNLTVIKFNANNTVTVQIFNNIHNQFNTTNYDHLNIGDIVAFGTINDVTPVFSYDSKDIELGFAGNSDKNIRSKSGWRGTTNDNSFYAHGTRIVEKITIGKNESMTVKLSAKIED